MEDSRAFLGSEDNGTLLIYSIWELKDRETKLSRMITRSGVCNKIIKVSIHCDGNAKRRLYLGETHEFKPSWICRSGNRTRHLGWK